MNADTLVLALLAIGDLALLVGLRQRHRERQEQRVRMERVMASLRMAVHRENALEALPEESPLLRAS
jgi:hypothetical protein